ncbi:MAG: hypothetical protein HN521_17600 [Candidatus Latescibacteria bacterium]|nr:hypothetical protein [Candidatus Latescibacterota bacterium]MBT5830214.1 hypothetical protein [Candidatus Latescibacterota bacterium]
MDFSVIEVLLENFAGLKIRNVDRAKFERLVLQHMESKNILKVADYAAHLTRQVGSMDGDLGDLVRGLTVGESYVFRDHGQMAVIQNQVLSDIIAHQEKSRKIRIWSAGCSTGEEVYSLAMVLQDRLPEPSTWQIQVIGTDINSDALLQAQKGHYRDWSFRSTPEDLKRRYFKPIAQGWCVEDSLREWTRFEYMNLIQDGLPSMLSLGVCDFILCRNVFIYFQRASIAGVLKKFLQALRPGGYLMTGHAELYDQDIAEFEPLIYDGSIVYRCRDAFDTAPRALPKVQKPVQNLRLPKKPKRQMPVGQTQQIGHAQADEVQLVMEMIGDGKLDTARSICEQRLAVTPDDADWLYLYARVQADLGVLEMASQVAHKALERRKTWVHPIFLLAQLAEETGNRQQAQTYLEQCLYLEPDFVLAYISLAQILDVEGEKARGQKLLDQAIQLLSALPQSAKIDPFAKTTASEWLNILRLES